MIIKNDLFETFEKKFILNKIKNFNSKTKPGDQQNNSYHRDFIDKENELIYLKSFIENIKQIIIKNFNQVEPELVNTMWINKIDNTSNRDDKYHIDFSKFSTITFLNDNFEGGEFEYWDSVAGKFKLLKPKPFQTIIFSGNNTKHKVNAVNNGVRYSLVSFWDIPKKSFKTLL